MTKAIKQAIDWMRLFFFNYLWLGVVIVLIAVILNIHYPDTQTRGFFLSIGIGLIESIGIAIIVASIFTYASGTSQFVGYIRELLEEIVVKRDFLGNIDPESKKDALKALIQPSEAERSKYPNIASYYEYFIDKTLSIGKKSVRSYYQVNSRVFVSPETQKIMVEGTYSYRLYPSSTGFADINVGFEEEEECSTCSYIAVSTPEGERKLFDKLELKPMDEGGDKSRRATVPVAELGRGHERLDIELKVTECGADHWALITFKALQPTDGFKFHLHCEGDLRIKKHAIFVVGATYYVDSAKDGCDISITCNQWINEGSGLTVLVALPHEKIPNNQVNKDAAH